MIQTFIGLEIHIQLLTFSKVFCSCRAAFGDEPNTNVCPVCLGYPGVLPVLNKEAIKKSYLVANALDCDLSRFTVFERKNYYYPDLPKNYQISQFEKPLGTEGKFEIPMPDGSKTIRIKECHLEEDAGKMIHAGDESLLDYNRTGTPLLEIVTHPDFTTGEEAEIFLQNFRRTVRYLEVCDGNMEEGSLRCDANVSVNFEGKGLGNKVEIKNMNSFKFVRKALAYEIKRQSQMLEAGTRIAMETRLWDENKDCTTSMRTKESSNDYRYFPEPDLPPFRPDDTFIAEITSNMVELPYPRKKRFIKEYGINEAQADFLTDELSVAEFYEATVALGADPKKTATWLSSDVQKILNRKELELYQSPLTPARMVDLLDVMKSGRIHGKIAKQVLEAIFEENKDPLDIIKEKGLEQISDTSELKNIVTETLQENQSVVEQIQNGEHKAKGFLVGQIMKKTQGRADPKMVQQILAEQLEEQ